MLPRPLQMPGANGGAISACEKLLGTEKERLERRRLATLEALRHRRAGVITAKRDPRAQQLSAAQAERTAEHKRFANKLWQQAIASNAFRQWKEAVCRTAVCFLDSANVEGWWNGTRRPQDIDEGTREVLTYFGPRFEAFWK